MRLRILPVASILIAIAALLSPIADSSGVAVTSAPLAQRRPRLLSDGVGGVFSLRDGSPATLELLDVSGRRVASRRIETLGAGGHVVRFGEASRLAPGIYTARLTQGGRAVAAHVAVVR